MIMTQPILVEIVRLLSVTIWHSPLQMLLMLWLLYSTH